MNVNPNAHHFSQDDKRKIRELISEGIKVNKEVDDMKEGLKEVIKDISMEMDIPVSTLNKAIRTAYKGNLRESQDEIELIEELIEIGGRNS